MINEMFDLQVHPSTINKHLHSPKMKEHGAESVSFTKVYLRESARNSEETKDARVKWVELYGRSLTGSDKQHAKGIGDESGRAALRAACVRLYRENGELRNYFPDVNSMMHYIEQAALPGTMATSAEFLPVARLLGRPLVVYHDYDTHTISVNEEAYNLARDNQIRICMHNSHSVPVWPANPVIGLIGLEPNALLTYADVV